MPYCPVEVAGLSSSARKHSFSITPSGAACRRRTRDLPEHLSPSSASSNGNHVSNHQPNRRSPRLRGVCPSPRLRDRTESRHDLHGVFSATDEAPLLLPQEDSDSHSDSQSRVLIGETQVGPSQEQGQPQEQLVAESNDDVHTSLPAATLRNGDDNCSVYSSPSSVSDNDAGTNNIDEYSPTKKITQAKKEMLVTHLIVISLQVSLFSTRLCIT